MAEGSKGMNPVPGRLNRGGKENPARQEKAPQVTTPPGQQQKPKYGDKKIVKAIKPRKKGE
jgi:hypothetical protein